MVTQRSQILSHSFDHRTSRRRALGLTGTAVFGLGAALAGSSILGATSRANRQATPVVPSPDGLLAITEELMGELGLRSTLLHVTVDGDVLVSEALGESMTGVPATTDMRFRNGAVAISLMSTLMLILVDDGVIALDDPLSTWLPDLPEADTATFRMLANMTAGYRDHVQSADFTDTTLEDPFRSFTPDEILGYSLDQPRLFAPGTNWEYSHTNYFILARAIEAATGQPLAQSMQTRVLDPLGLTATTIDATPRIPEPALHAYSSERREWLGIAPGTRFYEESSFWDPSWTLPPGAVQTSNIQDFGAAMVAIGEGTLLSAESSADQLDRGLLGFGTPLEGCNTCRTLTENLVYGLGVVLRGPWVLQNPMFYGYTGVSAYWPERRLSIAVANTYGESAFDATGQYQNASVPLFAALADQITRELSTPAA
ncbi:MAG TPA: serine hydrolase domain-containing protein [Thermomicrobiales bacterium]|jgi:CubicO group peptidase (beta-lactamase class C family)|nr:serine hydrolase domain-containing protein [Thermomicrobiales bacterium]